MTWRGVEFPEVEGAQRVTFSFASAARSTVNVMDTNSDCVPSVNFRTI